MSCHCSSCVDGSLALIQPTVARLSNTAAQGLSSRLIPTPPELAREYQAMLDRAQAKRRPQLMCRDHVAQVGRWFAQGVLVLGFADIRVRAGLLDKALTVLRLQGRWSRPVPDLDGLDKFARLQILAHELGHELNRHDQRVSPFDSHPEAAADYWAGWLEAQRPGSDEEMGALFFAAIGCNEEQCSHPKSSVRAEAYRAGFRAGRQVAEQPRQQQSNAGHSAPRTEPPPPAANQGSSLGEVLGAIGLGAIAVAGVAAAAKGLANLLEYDKPPRRQASRSRPKKGRSRRS